MTPIFVSLAILIFASVTKASSPPDCSVVLTAATDLSPLLRGLDTLPQHGLGLEPWVKPAAGQVFHVARPGTFPLHREGNYPVLIFSDGSLVISHRLPDTKADASLQPYLATHLSLFRQAEMELGQPRPAVVFAGQVRVIGGRPVRLVDQSGHFHENIPKIFEGEGQHHLRAVALRGIADRNQHRLNLARSALHLAIGLPTDLPLLNLVEHSIKNEQEVVPDGHMVDRDLALFELRCRRDAKCWDDYKVFQDLIRRVFEHPQPERWMMAHFDDFRKQFGMTGFTYLTFFIEAVKVGALDFMATERFHGSDFAALLRAAPQIRQVLEKE